MNLTNIIGTGKQATIYRDGNYAIKVLNENYYKSGIFHEAYIHTLLEETNLLFPKVYEVGIYNSNYYIKMDYIAGKSLINCILEDQENVYYYVNKMVELQIRMHSYKIKLPSTFKEKIYNKIYYNENLDVSLKNKMLNKLSTLPNDDSLCHGDFHGFNILVTNEDLAIIDWADAGSGSVYGDVCRSYSIFLIHAKELADMYLDLYCQKAKIDRNQVIEWLPVIMTACLSENMENIDELISLYI